MRAASLKLACCLLLLCSCETPPGGEAELPSVGGESSVGPESNAAKGPRTATEIRDAILDRPINPPSSRRPVSMIAYLFPMGESGDHEAVVALRLKILDGWHTYGDLPEDSPFRATVLQLELPEAITPQGEWIKPVSELKINADGLETIAGDVVFQHKVSLSGLLSGESLGTVIVDFQVCDEAQCLPPQQLRIPINSL